MEVLEKGSGKGNWSAIVECTGKGNSYDNAKKRKLPCGSKLKIDITDIFTTSHTFIDGSTDYYYTIKCPRCGCLTDIDKSLVPYSLQDYISNNDEFTF